LRINFVYTSKHTLTCLFSCEIIVHVSRRIGSKVQQNSKTIALACNELVGIIDSIATKKNLPK